MTEDDKLDQEEYRQESYAWYAARLRIDTVKPIDGIDAEDGPQDEKQCESSLRDHQFIGSDKQFLRPELSDIDSKERSQNMSDQSEDGRNFPWYLAYIMKLFHELKQDDRQTSDQKSSENSTMEDNRKANRYDGKKSQIDKNALHGRYGFSRVFQVIAWLI